MSRLRRVPAVAGALLLAAPLAGCAGRAGGQLRPDVALPCASAIPVARTAVHGKGRLVVIRKARSSDLAGSGLSASESPRPTEVCVLAYDGGFTSTDVPGAQGTRGRYAVVLTTVRHPHVLLVALTDRLPPG